MAADTLQTSILRVLNAEGETIGASFLLAPDLAVTCAHVVQAARGAPAQPLTLADVHGKSTLAATVLEEGWSPADRNDLAFLRLDSPAEGLQPVLLSTSANRLGRHFGALGFPADADYAADWCQGDLGGLVPAHVEGRADILQFQGAEIRPGMSGAPVLDIQAGQVVGMVCEYKTAEGVRRAYAVSAETTQAACPQSLQLASFQPSTAVLSLRQIPEPPPDFTGRKKEIKDLLDAIQGGGAHISGLQGAGGIGKTALACVVARELGEKYPAQLFLDLHGTDPNPASPFEVMGQVIHACQPDLRLPDNPDELVTLYRTVLSSTRALLLFDNARDAAQLAALLPLPAGCLALVTSRRHFALPGLHALHLDTLPLADARKLLVAIHPPIGRLAGLLAEQCGRLPLALRAAASLLRQRRDWSARMLCDRLADAARRLELADASRQELTVQAVLQASFDLLPADLQPKWAQLSVFADTFDVLAAAAVWEIERDPAQEALSELLAWSVVEFSSQERRYRLHDLARAFAAGRLPVPDRDQAALRHAGHFLEVLRLANRLFLQGNEHTLQGLALFDREWLNIRTAQAWASRQVGSLEGAARLASEYPDGGVYCLSLRLHPRELIAWLEAGLAGAEKLDDAWAKGDHLGNLGLAYAALGEPRRAIQFYEQALQMAREIGDRRGEGANLGNLGVVYAALGEPRKAIQFYEQALQIVREIGDRRGEGADLGNLGLAYADLGELRKAIQLYEQALQIAGEMGDRRGEGNHLGNLGLAYAALGEPRRAIQFYEQRLEIDREIGDRRGEGIVLGNLGVAYAALRGPRRAIQFYEQALQTAGEMGDRRGEGNALGNLGNAYAALGKPRKAIQFHEQALQIAHEMGDRRGEGNALGNLGLAYAALGEPRRAIQFHEQALQIAREIGDRLGEGNHLGNLGLAYAALGEQRKAIRFYEQRLVIAREIGDRQGEAYASWNLGLQLKEAGELAQAMRWMQVCLVFERDIGHPDYEADQREVEELRRRLEQG